MSWTEPHKNWTVHRRIIRVRNGNYGRDELVEEGSWGGRKSRNPGGGHLHQKEINDDEGWQWRSERRLMETTITANEISEETRVDCWPIHLSDVFQADTWDVTKHGLQY